MGDGNTLQPWALDQMVFKMSFPSQTILSACDLWGVEGASGTQLCGYFKPHPSHGVEITAIFTDIEKCGSIMRSSLVTRTDATDPRLGFCSCTGAIPFVQQ